MSCMLCASNIEIFTSVCEAKGEDLRTLYNLLARVFKVTRQCAYAGEISGSSNRSQGTTNDRLFHRRLYKTRVEWSGMHVRK